MNFCQVLLGSLEENQTLSGEIISNQSLSGNLEYQAFVETYTGTYEVTPKITPQVLETQGLRMEKDVSVNGIPISVIENQSKGNTVFIG